VATDIIEAASVAYARAVSTAIGRARAAAESPAAEAVRA
jgi:hypothetical protein